MFKKQDLFGPQVSTPSKSKCQCHMIQQGGSSKKEPEGENIGGGEVTLRTHQPPALPPRPPPRPARRFETVTSDPCKSFLYHLTTNFFYIRFFKNLIVSWSMILQKLLIKLFLFTRSKFKKLYLLILNIHFLLIGDTGAKS